VLKSSGDTYNLAFDREGYLWATGYGGVKRYDLAANSYTGYSRAEGLSASTIRGMIVDAQDATWIATDKEIQRFNGERWETFEKPTAEQTRSFAEGGDGTLWLCALDGVFSYKDGKWTQFGTHNGLIADKCWQMEIGPDGNPWVIAQNDSLSHFSGGWTNHELADNLRSEEGEIIGVNYKIFVAPDGDVWVPDMKWVTRFDGEGWNLYNLPKKEGAITAFGLSSSGTPWLAQMYLSKSYFRAFNGSDWPVIMESNSMDGLLNVEFTGVVAAPDGSVWFLGPKLFIRTMQTGWNVFPFASTRFISDFKSDVAFSKEGLLYYAGSEGILELDGLAGEGEGFTTYSGPGVLADNYIRDIQIDSQGVLWIFEGEDTGPVAGRLQRFDGLGFQDFKPFETTEVIQRYFVAGDGSLWVLQDQLARWDGDSWHEFSTGYTSQYSVEDIAQDNQGNIWVSFSAKESGVEMWNGEEFEVWPLEDTTPWEAPDHVALEFSPNGTLWAIEDLYKFYKDSGAWVGFMKDGIWSHRPITITPFDYNGWTLFLYTPQFDRFNNPILLYNNDYRLEFGLFEMQNDAWSPISLGGPGFPQTILYHADTFWVGTADNCLYYRKDSAAGPGTWAHLGAEDWRGGNEVSLLAAGKGDEVWAVTETGLALYKGGEWRYFPKGGDGLEDVTIIKTAPDGKVWFGSTTLGLASYGIP
jgi:ligand-binding sensor domain-containing protein